MISARLGHFLDKPLAPLVRHIPLTPNFFTVTGFVVTTVAAISVPFNPRVGGVLILCGGAFDLLDGIVARTNGKVTAFGAFLDSVLDRYADAFIFFGIAWYLFLEGENVGVVLSLGTLLGAFATSYARARAEGLGKECHVGVMERPERLIVISSACITGYIVPALWVVFILTHITVLQRIFRMKRQS